MTLYPSVEIGFAIMNDAESYSYSEEETVNDQPVNGTLLSGNYSRDEGYMVPDVTVGADIYFPENDGLTMSAGLYYAGQFDLFGDAFGTEYDSTEVQRAGTLVTTTVIDSTDFIERSSSSHTITPSFKLAKDFDALSLALKLDVGVGFGSTSRQQKTVETTTVSDTNNNGSFSKDEFTGRTTATSTLELAPVLNMGFRYKVGETQRWSLNAGFEVQFPALEKTTTELTGAASTTTTGTTTIAGTTTTNTPVVSNPDGDKTDVTTVETTWGKVTGTLKAGVTFNFTDNFVLDATYAISNTPSLLDLIDSNMGLQFTAKF
jgi:opacity protein-like surface antigen